MRYIWTNRPIFWCQKVVGRSCKWVRYASRAAGSAAPPWALDSSCQQNTQRMNPPAGSKLWIWPWIKPPNLFRHQYLSIFGTICGGLFPKMDEGTEKLQACRCFLCRIPGFFARQIEKKKRGTSWYISNTWNVGRPTKLYLSTCGTWIFLKHLRFLSRSFISSKRWSEAFCHAPPRYLSLVDGQEVILRKLQLKRWWLSPGWIQFEKVVV